MIAKHFLSVSILAAALAATASGALAAGETGSPSRADVKAAVLQARAHGELIPAGEAPHPFTVATGVSTSSRRQVRDDTLQARADGELIPAGQGPSFATPVGTQMARAEVKESVRQARLNSELIPAGQGLGPVEYQARAHTRRAEMLAATTRR
ncbi:MAG: hypothetical protein ACXWJ1_12810 [Caldimonas sp.]